MDECDLEELTGLITELGKDVVVDWAVNVATSAIVGVAVGTTVPLAGNAAGAVSGAVVGTVNTGMKIKKGEKYIRGVQQIIQVSKKIVEEKKIEKKLEKADSFAERGYQFINIGQGAKVDAKAVNKLPVKEILDNLGKQVKKLGDDIVDTIKELSESAIRGSKTTDFTKSNATTLFDKFKEFDKFKKIEYPKSF